MGSGPISQPDRGPLSARLGVVVAMGREARVCAQAAPGMRVRIAGMGPERARAAARGLLEDGCEALASVGLAGALSPALLPGALLLPEAVRDSSGVDFVTDPPWRQALCQRLGRWVPSRPTLLLSVARLVRTSGAKLALGRATGAAAVDMESAAVAAVAAAAAVPFMALRAVADGSAHTLPRAVVDALDTHGRAQPRRLMLGLVCRPLEIFALVAMARAVRAGERSLRRALARGGPSLALP